MVEKLHEKYTDKIKNADVVIKRILNLISESRRGRVSVDVKELNIALYNIRRDRRHYVQFVQDIEELHTKSESLIHKQHTNEVHSDSAVQRPRDRQMAKK